MKRLFFILIVILPFEFATAQLADRLSMPYECNFEDEDETSKWVLNYGTPSAYDQWVVGKSARNGGKHGLYVSSHTWPVIYTDGSVAPGDSAALFGARPNRIMAYRKFRLPEGGGRYDLSFDWKMIGNLDNPGQAKFYVYVGLASSLTSGTYPYLNYVSATSGAALPVRMQFTPFEVDGEMRSEWTSANGSKNWKFAHMTKDAPLKVTKEAAEQEFVILFIWLNNTRNSLSTNVGICIDNIQIASADVSRPDQFKVTNYCEDEALHMEWSTPADYIELQYRSVNDDDWLYSISPLYGGSYNLHMRNEGSYNLRVRAIKEHDEMEPDTSAWAMVNDVVYWCPDAHCINYVDLESEDVVCRYGYYGEESGLGIPPSDNTLNVGYIPDGREHPGYEDDWDKYARHRVIWEQMDDPRTIVSVDAAGMPVAPLRCVPDGVMATVRLGNPEVRYGHEDITYKLLVDKSYPLLVMNYAPVWGSADHSDMEGFEIQVMDQNMHIISANTICGNPQFSYNESLAEVWNTSGQYRWRDWSAFGFNLSAYVGRVVYIRIHNWDCAHSGHAGYLYYYMTCVSAELSTDNCGENSHIDIDAPAGFSYEWYDETGKLISTDRQLLNVESGHHNYSCKMCMTDPMTDKPLDCCLELYTSLEPRYPVPDYDVKMVPRECTNIVSFTDSSHVITRYADDSGNVIENYAQGEHIDQTEIWLYRLSDNKEVMHTVETAFEYEAPEEGEKLLVRQRAVFGGGACDSIMESLIEIPSILTPPAVLDTTICSSQIPFRFDQKGFSESVEYVSEKLNVAGCDSLTTLRLTVIPTSYETKYDTICSSDLPYVLNGFSYLYTGVATQYLSSKVNGCDSILTINLKVVERLELNVDEMPRVMCSDDGLLTIDWSNLPNKRDSVGHFDSVVIHFSDNALRTGYFRDIVVYDNDVDEVEIEFSDAVPADNYYVTLSFYQPRVCDVQTFVLPIEMHYGSIIEQKWNNVLMLLNEQYNHGFTFTEYQWYKDGIEIEGATLPYLYQDLDFDSEYTVRLTRTDGVVAFACPFKPSDRTDKQVSSFPTYVSQASKVVVHTEKTASLTIYTLTGNVYSTQRLQVGENSAEMPASLGMYVVRIFTEDGTDNISQPLMVGK